MNTNLYRQAIQFAVEETLAANIGEEQIRAWVNEKLTNAVDYYPVMHREETCQSSTP